MKIILRIIAFPLFAVIALIAALKQWVMYCYSYLKYGGEILAYTSKMNDTTIGDVFSELQKQNELLKNKQQ